MAKEDFRFFDSRQKYLLFVTTTNEKQVISDNLHQYIKQLKQNLFGKILSPTLMLVLNQDSFFGTP